jgi:hypothetical protein
VAGGRCLASPVARWFAQGFLRSHLAFISASAGYPRFFKASSTPSMSRSWDFASFVEGDLP